MLTANPTRFALFPALIAGVMLIQGCGKEPQLPGPASTSGSGTGSAAPDNAAAAKVIAAASVPKADKGTPLESYAVLSGGKPLLFSYYALSGMPVDYEIIAKNISADYSLSSDEFKKRDILAALKPGIDSAIDEAKAKRYFKLSTADGVRAYDFDSKSFPHQSLGNEGIYFSFNDAPAYRLVFSNGSAFGRIKVPEDTDAREIERRRAALERIGTRVYFFLSDVELGSRTVRAEITRVELVDGTGRVLASM